MRQTNEQREYRAELEGHIRQSGERWRIRRDDEGYAYIPGKYGRIEYYGADGDGVRRLRVYTHSMRVERALERMGGLRVQQRGDHEARLSWNPRTEADAGALMAVCASIKARVRRRSTLGPGTHPVRGFGVARGV
jgi:hypothetical protein